MRYREKKMRYQEETMRYREEKKKASRREIGGIEKRNRGYREEK